MDVESVVQEGRRTRQAFDGRRTAAIQTDRGRTQNQDRRIARATHRGAQQHPAIGEKIPLDVVNSETGEIIIPANRKITKTLFAAAGDGLLTALKLTRRRSATKSTKSSAASKRSSTICRCRYDEELERAESGEGVDSGVVKSVKVYIASSANCPWATRWPDGMATRGWWPRLWRRKTCLSLGRRHGGGHRVESAGRALAHERGPGFGNAPGWAARCWG